MYVFLLFKIKVVFITNLYLKLYFLLICFGMFCFTKIFPVGDESLIMCSSTSELMTRISLAERGNDMWNCCSCTVCASH